jgi:hypothetical protein
MDQQLCVVCLLNVKVAALASVQLPARDHAVRPLQLPGGQGRLDSLPDCSFCVWVSGEQDPHPNLAADAVRPAVMWRKRTRLLVIPMPTQRRRDSSTRSS